MTINPPVRITAWFDALSGEFRPGVLACVNDVLLLDRREIQVSCLSDMAMPVNGTDWIWIVYNDSDTRRNGEWTAYVTRKEAIKAFVYRALTSPTTGYPTMIAGTVAESAMRAELAKLD